MLQFSFDTTLIESRGPAPFVYAPVPLEHAGKIEQVSYGWGVIPVMAEIDGTAFTTSLFPRGGTYLLPIKLAVRKKNGITVGDAVAVTIAIGPRER